MDEYDDLYAFRYRGFFECKRNIVPLVWIIIGLSFVISTNLLSNTKTDIPLRVLSGWFNSGYCLATFGSIVGFLLNLYLPIPIEIIDKKPEQE